jgi:purine catabolism regulator
MPVTVEQVLKLDVLHDARLLAGGGGLQRRVTSVTVGEVPDIADWLSGGEMVLSTMFAVRGDLDRQREFMRRVMMAGAAALFVKTTRFVENVPADILALADKRNFPIIEVPQGLRWTRLMQDATEIIINRQASQLEKSQAIHRDLLGVVIRGGGWQELANEVSRLMEKPIIVVDSSLELLAASKTLDMSKTDLEAALGSAEAHRAFTEVASVQKVSSVAVPGLPAMFALPIVSSLKRLGYVCALTDQAELSALETLALEHSATIAALEMAQDRVRFETEVRLKGDLVDEVISGSTGEGDSLLRRGTFLGCDLSRGATILLLGVDEYDGVVPRKSTSEEELSARIEQYFLRCSRFVSLSEISSLVSLKSGHIVVFLCWPKPKEAHEVRKLAGRLQALAGEVGDLSVSVGIGSHVPSPRHLNRGYQEALVALKVGRKLNGPGSVLHFSNVGTYKLLFDIWERNPDEVRSLYEETIAAVDRYDEQTGSQLVHTLTVYLRNNENLTKTAEELYAHRHTIRYRLAKIAEITGLSVLQSEHKERLGLGLKARGLLQG